MDSVTWQVLTDKPRPEWLERVELALGEHQMAKKVEAVGGEPAKPRAITKGSEETHDPWH